MEVERSGGDMGVTSEELLSQLMAALASGARAVQGIPIDDDYEYHSSYPEFRTLIEETHEGLLDTLVLALSVDDSTSKSFDSLDDPLLWEALSDACDSLLEQAEEVSSLSREDIMTAKNQARTSFGRLIQGIVEMEKPQEVHGFGPTCKEDDDANDRTAPFVPPIVEKYHAKEPLDLSLKPGHGLENRFGNLRKNIRIPQVFEAPTEHVPHVYATELETLKFTDWQLEAPESKPPKITVDKELDAIWVDTPQKLRELEKSLENVQEIALDLEAHSYRSFSGIVCLIQLTFGDHENYLIDPFPLWDQLSSVLGPVLANPNVVKVLHGADSDVQWLQRDFGMYIVNLFDTGRAARALSMASAGYAHLLKHYVGIIADKSHQLSDWRQRPLPPAMRQYAIMDTHYLLDIYQHLKYDLEQHATATIEQVLGDSRNVCMIRYAPEIFKPEGYRTLLSRRGSKTELNSTQEGVLKDLWNWRDQIARQADESLAYVCTNQALLRLSLACPTSLTALQGLLKPMPELLLRNSQQVLNMIQRHVNKVKVPSSAFFKPATAERATEPRDNRLLSPVLGTEALYRQAGWISPSPNGPNHIAEVHTTTDDDDNDEVASEELKPRRVLAVHQTNDKYQSSQFSGHSLQLGEHGRIDIGITDGMGPARVAHSQNMEEEAHVARVTADKVRNAQESSHAMIGLISPVADMEDDDDEVMDGDEDDRESGSGEKGNDQEDFVIPRSMREIYRISNRNRRNKKSSSPSPQEPNKEEADELAKAEAILKARSLEGKSYFDEMPGSPKRQRTKSTGTASLSSDEAPPGNDSGSVSREEDVALMQDIGWVKDKEEVDGMMKEKLAADSIDDAAEVSSEDEASKTTKPFDYSSIGPIGAFSATPSANPFFTGAATTGGHLNQQFGKQEKKKKQNAGNRGKQSRRQIERPEKREERAQAYKKR